MSGSGRTAIATLTALGVVFGDIGTSPLYALSTVYRDAKSADEATVYGVTSMVVWCVTLVVTVLYVRILMRYDNEGEGGLLALLALIRRASSTARLRTTATVLAMVGAAMFLGDSTITPAISVLSAVEGASVASADAEALVVPLTVVVLVLLFIAQRFGTARIGALFGPIMFIWFAVSAAFGVMSLAQTPDALVALSPHWIVLLVAQHPSSAFFALGGVVLTVTGAEALFADMGHLGPKPVTLAWLVIVYPALLVTYLGQAGAVLRHPKAASSPFYAAVPDWATVPTVVLATAATVIASQAVLSGAFSVVQQAGRLGLVPRLHVIHTSSTTRGQVYLPAVNVLLAIGVISLVITFKTSAALAAAYGIAASITVCMTASLLLALLAARHHAPWLRIGAVVGILAMMGIIVAANLTKIASGGWIPLGIGAALCLIMWTWRRGRRQLLAARREAEEPLEAVAELAEGLKRAPGTAIYVTHSEDRAPSALSATVDQYQVLSENVIVVTVTTTELPRGHAVEAENLAPGIVHAHARFGYREPTTIVDALRDCADLETLGITDEQLASATYTVSSNTPVLNRGSSMPTWQQRLFIALSTVTQSADLTYRLPTNRTVVMGRELSL